VDGVVVATTQSFVFNSAAYLPKTYNISLRFVDDGVKFGDAVQIKVQ